MSEPNFGSSTPQFGTAEYASKSGDICKSCNQAISGQYYRVNGSLACGRCVEQLKNQIPKDRHSIFVRGVAFGIGGAILGLILYSIFTIVTGLEIGYVSLAVGWIVAKAIKMGSKGMGGRRYQIAAILLTYSAVSMAAIPIYISSIIKDKAPKQVQTKRTPSGDLAPVTPNSSPSQPDNSNSDAPASPRPKISPLKVIGVLVFVGLASPFLGLQDPFHGAIGLVILFVGMNIAWRLTAGSKVDIIGPFNASAPASS